MVRSRCDKELSSDIFGVKQVFPTIPSFDKVNEVSSSRCQPGENDIIFRFVFRFMETTIGQMQLLALNEKLQ